MNKLVVLLLLSAVIAGARHLDVTTSTWSTRLSAAVAGDTLHLADGTYSIISPSQDGTLSAPIVVQGTSKTTTIIAGGGEGFVWYPKHWVWENIWFRGDGGNDHLFHLKQNTKGYLTWRNCHFSGVADKVVKIDQGDYNGPSIYFADYVLMENCTVDVGGGGLMNNDGSDFLTCRGNYTYHYVTGTGGPIYIYFTKGGNAYTVFENNIDNGGVMIFSFGGGTMYTPYYSKWRHDDETWGAVNTPKPGTTGNYGYKEVETYRSICRNNIVIGASMSAFASQATIDCEFYNNTVINCVATLAKEFQNGRATRLRLYNNLTINGGDDLQLAYGGYSDGDICIAEHNKALGTRTLSDIFVSVNTSNYSLSDWHLKSAAIATQIGTGIAPYDHPTWPAYYSLLGSGNYDFYGAQHSNPPILGATQLAGTGIEENAVSAGDLSIVDVMPNPATPATALRLSLALDRPIVDILVCDVRGKHVRSLYYGPMEAGQRNVAWDGRDHFNRLMASGTYFFRVSLGHDVLMKKFQLVR
ncbi:MAG: FlgD immunoglobulin-like domain containing protein [Fibrobacterota bacterium]